MSSPWPDWPSRGAWPRGTIRARGRRLNAAPDQTGTARARSVLGQSMPAFGVPPSRKGHSKNSAADVRLRHAEHEHKRAARGAICPVRARTRRGPCSDRACRLLVYRQAGKVTAKLAPRTRINVLQSTSVSELPKARFAPCGHAPRIAPCGHARHSAKKAPPKMGELFCCYFSQALILLWNPHPRPGRKSPARRRPRQRCRRPQSPGCPPRPPRGEHGPG